MKYFIKSLALLTIILAPFQILVGQKDLYFDDSGEDLMLIIEDLIDSETVSIDSVYEINLRMHTSRGDARQEATWIFKTNSNNNEIKLLYKGKIRTGENADNKLIFGKSLPVKVQVDSTFLESKIGYLYIYENDTTTQAIEILIAKKRSDIYGELNVNWGISSNSIRIDTINDNKIKISFNDSINIDPEKFENIETIKLLTFTFKNRGLNPLIIELPDENNFSNTPYLKGISGNTFDNPIKYNDSIIKSQKINIKEYLGGYIPKIDTTIKKNFTVKLLNSRNHKDRFSLEYNLEITYLQETSTSGSIIELIKESLVFIIPVVIVIILSSLWLIRLLKGDQLSKELKGILRKAQSVKNNDKEEFEEIFKKLDKIYKTCNERTLLKKQAILKNIYNELKTYHEEIKKWQLGSKMDFLESKITQTHKKDKNQEQKSGEPEQSQLFRFLQEIQDKLKREPSFIPSVYDLDKLFNSLNELIEKGGKYDQTNKERVGLIEEKKELNSKKEEIESKKEEFEGKFNSIKRKLEELNLDPEQIEDSFEPYRNLRTQFDKIIEKLGIEPPTYDLISLIVESYNNTLNDCIEDLVSEKEKLNKEKEKLNRNLLNLKKERPPFYYELFKKLLSTTYNNYTGILKNCNSDSQYVKFLVKPIVQDTWNISQFSDKIDEKLKSMHNIEHLHDLPNTEEAKEMFIKEFVVGNDFLDFLKYIVAMYSYLNIDHPEIDFTKDIHEVGLDPNDFYDVFHLNKSIIEQYYGIQLLIPNLLLEDYNDEKYQEEHESRLTQINTKYIPIIKGENVTNNKIYDIWDVGFKYKEVTVKSKVVKK